MLTDVWVFNFGDSEALPHVFLPSFFGTVFACVRTAPNVKSYFVLYLFRNEKRLKISPYFD